MGIPIHAAAAFVFIAILITKTFRALSFSISRDLGFRPPGVRASYTIRSFSDRAPVRARRGSRTAEDFAAWRHRGYRPLRRAPRLA